MVTVNKVEIDEACVEFGHGKFDDFCVYYKPEQNSAPKTPKDTGYFNALLSLSKKYGTEMVYKDFVNLYNMTDNDTKPEVIAEIQRMSLKYRNHPRHPFAFCVVFTILYFTMVAEENKENAILKKRIKRLGVHMVLIDGVPSDVAANFSKGKNWRTLSDICRSKGF